MTLQWTIVAWFLYVEVAAVALLVLPVLSVQRWRRIFRSRLLRKLDNWGNMYFNMFLALLVVAVFDALRSARKHGAEAATLDEKTNLQGHSLCQMRMFRAHRNLYIAGGALLLWVVLKWMIRSVSQRAVMEADLLAAQRQAGNASATAKQFMEASGGDKVAEAAAKQARERLAEVEGELRQAKADLEAMTAQGKSAGRAFDELADENEKLRGRLAMLESDPTAAGEEGKKDA